jgi:hypothetical protein
MANGSQRKRGHSATSLLFLVLVLLVGLALVHGYT